MNKRQISNFLNSIIPGLRFNFRYGSNYQCEKSPAAVDDNNIIWINRDTFSKFELLEQKSMLMHEVGHILTRPVKGNTNSEFVAQFVALLITKKKGWKKLYEVLSQMFDEWANELKWNDKGGVYRRYILAGRRYQWLKKQE
jgi:hypothetical protein